MKVSWPLSKHRDKCVRHRKLAETLWTIKVVSDLATTFNDTAVNCLTCSSTRPPTFCANSTKFRTSPLINASKSSICGGIGVAAGAAGAGAGFGGSGGAGAAAGDGPMGFGALGSSIAMAISSRRDVAASSLLARCIVSRAGKQHVTPFAIRLRTIAPAWLQTALKPRLQDNNTHTA